MKFIVVAATLLVSIGGVPPPRFTHEAAAVADPKKKYGDTTRVAREAVADPNMKKIYGHTARVAREAVADPRPGPTRPTRPGPTRPTRPGPTRPGLTRQTRPGPTRKRTRFTSEAAADPGLTLHATCDNNMKIFADTNLLTTNNDWTQTSEVDIPENANSIEIHCYDYGVVGGILASFNNGLKTDGTWSCSADGGSTWNPAYEIGSHGMSPWEVVFPHISTEAKWIWTGKDTYHGKHKNVICKISLGTWTPGVWLNDDASQVTINIGEETFNSLFASCPVVRYTRNDAVYAVYMRTSPVPSSFNAFKVFTDTWASQDNQLGTDFNLYSSVEEAEEDEGAWTFCNYDDADVGFPRDCGPGGVVVNRWFSMPGGRVQARGVTSGIGFDIYTGSMCLVSKECNNGGELLSITSDNNMALCKDIKNNTCEKDLFYLCPVGWHLCNPKEFNNRNDDWSYTTPALTFGQMYCRPNGGTSPFVITNSLNQDDPGNCGHYWSSRLGCELWEGAQYDDGACNNKDATALCCAPAHKCGNGAVDSVEEECDDGNDNEIDDCLNSCAWRTPFQHGLNYCQ